MLRPGEAPEHQTDHADLDLSQFLELVFRSYSRLWIRQRPSHANVRSTTQRHLITLKPSLPAGRLTTSITYQPYSDTQRFKL